MFHDLVGVKSAAPRAKARTNITPASPVASALRRAASPRVQCQPFKPAPASHGLKSSPDRQPRFFNVFVRAGGCPAASHSVLGTQTRLRTSPVAPHHAIARRPLTFRELPTIWEHDGEEQDSTEAVERSNLSMRSHGSQTARTGDQEGVLSSSPCAAALSSQQSSGSKLTTEHTQSPTGSPASMGSQKMVPRQIPLAKKLAGQQREAHSVPATKYTTLALAQTLVPQPGSPGSRGSSEASKTAPVGAPLNSKQKKKCSGSAAANMAEPLPKKEKKTLKVRSSSPCSLTLQLCRAALHVTDPCCHLRPSPLCLHSAAGMPCC